MLHKLSSYTVHTTLIFASAIFSPIAFAADAPADAKIGTTVTITGCMHAGKHSDQFVLVGVTEKLAGGLASPTPYAIYWLDSYSGMKSMVGGLVEVTGVVVKRDSREGKIKIDVHPGIEESMDVKVQAAGKPGMTTKEFSGSPDEESSIELTRPVYRVHVQSLAPLGVGAEACR